MFKSFGSTLRIVFLAAFLIFIIVHIDFCTANGEVDKSNTNGGQTQSVGYHDYYSSKINVNKQKADETWKNITPNAIISYSPHTTVMIDLSFSFPFYGYDLRNISVSKNGFIHTGTYGQYAQTQYIAPLMADFDTGANNEALVLLNDNGTAITVIWQNLLVKNKYSLGAFTFSATLHKSGDIIFTYFKIPASIESISTNKYPVKIGLSDAYIEDQIIFFTAKKIVREYSRIDLSNADIKDSTIIYLQALPNCIQYTNCASCAFHYDTKLTCKWCPALGRCSTGVDRNTQTWTNAGCPKSAVTQIPDCAIIEDKNISNTNDKSTTNILMIPNNNNQQLTNNTMKDINDKMNNTNQVLSIDYHLNCTELHKISEDQIVLLCQKTY